MTDRPHAVDRETAPTEALANFDERVSALVSVVMTMAAGTLSSLDLGAAIVASKARGDVRVIAEVRRRVNRLAMDRPDRTTRQASELVRCALAIGDWDWDAYDSAVGQPHPD